MGSLRERRIRGRALLLDLMKEQERALPMDSKSEVVRV
jgi:hypothetical protein